MSLSIVTAMCGAPEITRQWLHETVGRCDEAPELIIVSNGSTEDEVLEVARECELVYERWPRKPPLAEWYIEKYPEPLGSTKPLNIGINLADGDVVACLHNDLMIKEEGWDREVLDYFAHHAQIGVLGLHGSKMLGTRELYVLPYEKHQLSRGDSYSNMEDAESHGARTHVAREVATLDGMALIARRDNLLAWGGFDETYTHHMYDHDLCLTARSHGFVNVVAPISCRHISGQTANQPRYNDHLESQGIARDQEIHDRSHLAFYEKWRGTGALPARV